LWTAIPAASLAVALVYGAVFESIYREPVDAQGGIVFFLLAFLTVLIAYGIIRLLSRFVRRK
jgi:hypothetical protein